MPPRVRPHWHVDGKWLAALLLLVLWSATLLGVGLYRLSGERVAVPLLTTLLAASFSREGLDSEKDLAEFRERLRTAPEQTLRPIEDLKLAVRYEEVEGLTPRETRLVVFRKLAEPLYRDGAEGILRLSRDVTTEGRDRLRRDTAVIAPVTRDWHERLRTPVVVLGAAALLVLALLVYFSAGLGRLVSPGLVLTLAGLPGLVLLAIRNAARGEAATLPAGETADVGYVAREAIPIAAPALTSGYLVSLGLGAALILAAVVGRLAWGRRARQGRAGSAEAQPASP